jgi:hypothetical protein
MRGKVNGLTKELFVSIHEQVDGVLVGGGNCLLVLRYRLALLWMHVRVFGYFQFRYADIAVLPSYCLKLKEGVMDLLGFLQTFDYFGFTFRLLKVGIAET